MIYDAQYVHKLGMSPEWKFIDVYDLSTDGLQSVPHPVAATLFLFPDSLLPQVGTCIGWACLLTASSFSVAVCTFETVVHIMFDVTCFSGFSVCML